MPMRELPGIVLAPYGTLFPSALATYDQIQKAYEREFPGSPVRLAFTSHLMKARLLEKEGISVQSLLAALAELHDLGCESVVVQSLQIVPGGEFHQVAALVQGLKGSKAGLLAPGDWFASALGPAGLPKGLIPPALSLQRARIQCKCRRRKASAQIVSPGPGKRGSAAGGPRHGPPCRCSLFADGQGIGNRAQECLPGHHRGLFRPFRATARAERLLGRELCGSCPF